MKHVCNTIVAFLLLNMADFHVASAQASFKTTSINGQVWMAENLDVDHFRNGDPIPEAKTDKEWVKAGENKQPAWCYYYKGSMAGVPIGKIYNWYAHTDPRGLAPEGWRIPTDDDFKAMIQQYQNNRELLYAVLIKGGITGMNIPLAGWRGRKGELKDFEQYGTIWSATEKGKWVSYLELNPQSRGAGMREGAKETGCYVRCIKVE
jgi:uncharacterized protein (TIGR02145 family)